MKVLFALTLFFALISAGPVNLRGINYGFQLPDGSCPSYEQVLADWKQVATYAQAVKIFSLIACDGAQWSLQAIRDGVGLQFFWGMNAGEDFPRELDKIRQLKGMGFSFDHIIGITVGSEDIYRNDNDDTVNNLLSGIRQTKSTLQSLGITNIPVTHTDVYFKQPANLVAEMDVVMFNAFTFWEGSKPEDGLAAMQSHFSYMQTISQGKSIWLGETGWPTEGPTQAFAIPSIDNQQKYLQSFVCWANANNINYFWFEHHDELWKQSQGAIETSFGLFKDDRTPKASFTMDCSQTPYPSGQNVPAIAMGGFVTPTKGSTSSTIPSTTSSTTSSTFSTTSSTSSTTSPTTSSTFAVPATTSSTVVVETPTTSSTAAPVTTSAVVDVPSITRADSTVARPQTASAAVLSVSVLCFLAAFVF